ncbi:hypothetical protein CH63R_14594 [Colletotrichum higginsianum IMI 349063]|uniref:Uncharacterized protein n=1 Tax=Colletotrichum higginsianum (strain IMI 349063) TaxID=759273 RepID=A0A1B7XQH8_COLHI|nr:hypothetical protein CH63R_14594 [Colletotrichum higginsianum IMI 349063]OBR02022.1 hypothetical protein CH63R_14594 [Colletotrichum higginsianum IMI 349063]
MPSRSWRQQSADSDLTAAASYPCDAFTLLRFSVRLPVVSNPTTSLALSHKPYNHYDNDDDEDDDDDNSDDDGVDETEAKQPAPQTHTWIQPLELCFHHEFLSPAARRCRPLSLHLDSLSASRISSISSSAAPIKRPTPPYYIHEMPQLIDLTTEPAEQQRQKANNNNNKILVALGALLMLVAGFLAGFSVNLSYLSVSSYPAMPASAAHTTSPHVAFLVGPLRNLFGIKQPYIIALSSETRPVELYRKILPITRQRMSLHPLMSDVAALPKEPLPDLKEAVYHVCYNITHYFDGYSKSPDARLPILNLFCGPMISRVVQLIRPWAFLPFSTVALDISGNLADSAWFLEEYYFKTNIHGNNNDDDNYLPVTEHTKFFIKQFRKMFKIKAESGYYADECRLCDPYYAGVLTPLESDHPDPFAYPHPPSPPVSNWHFACSPEFQGLYAAAATSSNVSNNGIKDDLITQFLLAWARSQSARRFNTLRNAPIDVDDKPLFPDDKHPFTEAEDVILPQLPHEAYVFAATRHFAEVAVAIDELIHLVEEEWHLILPITAADAAAEDDDDDDDDNKPSPDPGPLPDGFFHRVLDTFSESYRASADTQFRAHRQATLQARITASVTALRAMREDFVMPMIRRLGYLAAGISSGCADTADFLAYLDRLESEDPTYWEITEASVRRPPVPDVTHDKNNKQQQQTTTIDLTRVIFTQDAAVEIAGLRTEWKRLEGQVEAYHREQAELQQHIANEGREREADQEKEIDELVLDDRSRALLAGIRERMGIPQKQRLAEMLRAATLSFRDGSVGVSDHNNDKDRSNDYNEDIHKDTQK